jgi:copper chaperone CopZ/NADH:ubiquinone oxidoreductase subunit 3 (subunit A)
VETMTVALCPSSGTKGKKVSEVTLHALVKDEFQGQIAADADYYFCDAKGCDVVYFTTDGRTITKPHLKVEVGVKEAAGDRPLCYCFGHSVATVKEEIRTKGRSDALEDVRQKMKDLGCACEATNPSGSCCLGTVSKGIETAKAELNGTTTGRSRAETISKVGTVLSAIMASACCWLPLLLLAFGVSGAGIAGALDAYRPLFIALTVAFLAAAFYFTYRPRKAASASEDCCATAHDCCATPAPISKRRFDVMTLNKVMLWAVTVLAVAFLFFPNYMKFFLSGGGSGEPAANNPLVRTTTFSVGGMTCEGCSVLVEKVIKDVPGVLSVKVDYDRKRAVITSEGCCPVPREAVLQALEKAGYHGEVIESNPSVTADKSDKWECCKSDKSECCQQGKKDDMPKQTPVQGNDPDKQIVFKMDGLRCPAVKGIGCGHMLHPVLASLDKIEGVEASSTNYTGTMIRVSVNNASERDKVAERVSKALTENNPVALAGDELKRALEKEQWRGTGRVGELSAIEFRTLALHRVKTFATAEKLDKETTDKLVKMAEDQWERIAKEARSDGATQPEDWGNRCKKSIPVFLEQAKESLTSEQLERFKKSLTNRCCDDPPEAPLPPINAWEGR